MPALGEALLLSFEYLIRPVAVEALAKRGLHPSLPALKKVQESMNFTGDTSSKGAVNLKFRGSVASAISDSMSAQDFVASH